MRLTTSPPSCAECHEIWVPKPPGTLWATPGLLRDSFTFTALLEYTLETYSDLTQTHNLFLVCEITVSREI